MASAAPTQTEADFQRQVIELARLYGWKVAHFRPALTASGRWSTPVQADGAGFPDLVLVHPERHVIFAELKTERGRVSTAQQAWLDVLNAAQGNRGEVSHEACLWRPSDFDEINRTLSGRYR